ncbi:MAG: DUF4976 domain-containing protein [Verrucomicrobiales bacterium]
MSIYPTLCALTGVAKPEWVEGHDIRPLLANPGAEWLHAAITTFGQNNHAIRTDRWRYIRYSDGGEELYDHRDDPYEWTNLASDPAHANTKLELAKNLPTTNVPALGGTRGKGDPTEAQKAKRKAKKKAKDDAR